MKLAISTSGRNLDADADPRFGRCNYYIIADSETMEFEVMDNPGSLAGGGAGISAAQAIVDKGVQALLTGNCGPNAYQVLSSGGIQLVTGVSGKVRDAIENYRSGKYQASTQANVSDHFGMGAVPGAKGGFGMGRGGGKGRGMGRGMQSGSTSGPDSEAQQHSREQELQALKNQSQSLAQQLSDIQRRIDVLGKK